MPNWKFKILTKDDQPVDPTQDLFFSTNIVGGLTAGMVRESIQNSLDAGIIENNSKSTVYVEYRIIEIDKDEFIIGLFKDLLPHLKSTNSGIHPSNVPKLEEKIKVLIVEDYNTTGLLGDVDEFQDPVADDKEAHNFYWFWRRKGKSGKRGKDIGRWGIGKTVFPASSKINSFFGITCRNDDSNKYLMGASELKIHYFEDKRETTYSPYGFYGNFKDPVYQYFVSPLIEIDSADSVFIENFERHFHVERRDPKTEENYVGLSIIIPFPWDEINSNEILKAVIQQFYYPVLSDKIVVKIDDSIDDIMVELKSDSIEESLNEIKFNEEDEHDSNKIKKLMSFSRWAMNLPDEEYITLNKPQIHLDQIWRKEWYINEEIEKTIDLQSDKFFQGERIAFEVPVKVHEKSNDPEFSWFYVYLEYDKDSSDGENYFIRDGITISNIKPWIKKGLRALVIIEENKLSSLLGDSENPAHTEWQKDKKVLYEKYISPDKTISFVINSLKNLYSYIIKPKEGLDYEALKDIFSIDIEDSDLLDDVPKPGEDKPKPSPPDDFPDQREQEIFIKRIPGGFEIKSNPNVEYNEKICNVELAYMIPKGNPLKRYKSHDFNLSDTSFNIESKGVNIEKVQDNSIIFSSDNTNDFVIKISGFDPARDLYIKSNLNDKEI